MNRQTVYLQFLAETQIAKTVLVLFIKTAHGMAYG